MKEQVTESIDARWMTLETNRGDIITRCEEYAEWTLPAVFPRQEMKNTEQEHSLVPIGPLAVNHLANKIVQTLFPLDRPFFALIPSEEIEDKLADAKDGAVRLEKLKHNLGRLEQRASRTLNMNKYRPQAVMSAKLLIITGNALEYDDPAGGVQVYSIRDYVVERDLSGRVLTVITRDTKAFGTFTKSVRDFLQQHQDYRTATANTPVTLYTRVEMNDEGKYEVTQSANNIPLPRKAVVYTADKLPWRVLVMNLARGEDYGRGLVEEQSPLFRVIEGLTASMVESAAIVADIKFLVDPASGIDVMEMNNSRSGTYHSGRVDGIGTAKVDRRIELQFLDQSIDRYSRQLANAFLMQSGMTRDAERVTAEEIRHDARELDTAFGGLYSRFAYEWQFPLARNIMAQLSIQDTVGGVRLFDAVVVTGIESLSRTGQLENMRMLMMDMAALNEIPEDVRAELSIPRVVGLFASARQIDISGLLKTAKEKQQDREAIQQQQNAMMQAEAQSKVAQKAGETAVQE